MRRLSTLTLALITLTTGSCPLAARAQERIVESFEVPQGEGARSLTRQVVVEHASGLNDAVIRYVTDTVSSRLRKEQDQNAKGPRLWGVALGRTEFGGQPLGKSQLLEGMDVWPLLVTYQPGANPDAPELWERARGEVEQALRIVQKRVHESRVREFQGRFEVADGRHYEAQQRLAEYNDELIKILTETGDFEYFRTEVQTLNSQARELGLEQVGVAARREAIEKRIDELRQRAAVEVDSDPVIAELQKLVEIQERRLELAPLSSPLIVQQQAALKGLRERRDEYARNVKEGVDLDTDVGYQRIISAIAEGESFMATQIEHAKDKQSNPEAAAGLVEARVTLLKAQRDASDRAQGSILAVLNDELSTLAIKAAELAEKQKAVENEVRRFVGKSDPKIPVELEMLKTRIALAKEQLAEAERRRAELERDAPPEPEQITLRPLEEALLGEGAEEKAD